MDTNNLMKNRYRAVLIGCALGDTLGMSVEGWKREQIIKYLPNGITHPIDSVVITDASGKEITEDEYGKLKSWTKGLKAGDWTDDTIFTMDIAESIAELGKIDIEDIKQRHVKSYDFYEKPNSGSHAFGGTTRKAIELIKQGSSITLAGFFGWPGNAPAMKMHPVGMYMHASGLFDESLTASQEISSITHLDPRSIASGAVQTRAIYELLNNSTREEFLSALEDTCNYFEYPLTALHKKAEKGTLLERIEWVFLNQDKSEEEAFIHLGASSDIFSSYPFSLFMFQKNWDDPIEGMLKTINYGGDCDTTGAIFGALAGARHGMIFPEEWLSVLRDKERIISIADKIYEINSHRNI